MNPNMSLADDDFKKNYVDGLLVIDCVEIKLTQNATTNPKSFSSAGYLLATPENGVEARIICVRAEGDPFDQFAAFRSMMTTKSGELFPASSYYTLEATDVQGHVWINPSVQVKIKERLASITITILCDHIRCEGKVDSGAALTHMVFVDDLEFPANVFHTAVTVVRGKKTQEIKAGSSLGEAAGMRLAFYPRSDRAGPKYSDFFAEALEGTTVPVGFENRLLEALRFTTATMVTPVMTETILGNLRTIELRQARPPNKGMVQPPISPRGHEEGFFRMIGCYYAYACLNAKGEDFAPLSTKIGGLFTLKHVWLDTVALLVAVGVESVLGEAEFKKLGKPGKGLLAEVEKLFAWIKAAKEVDGTLIERALSALGSMKSTRAKDQLFALIEIGAVDNADWKAWSALRMPAAHGSFSVDPEKMQELLDAVYRLVTLIYKLVFLKIGYDGPYTDCSSPGWPMTEFSATSCNAALDAKKV